jgi:uncharacterized membrane protein YfcA
MPGSLGLLFASLLAVFLGSMLSGMTGFGFALIAVPLLTLVLAPQTVVPMVRLQSLLTGTLVVLDARRWLDLPRVWLLIVASLVGLPLGVYLLTVWNTDTLKVFIGSVTVLFASLMLLGANIQLGEGPLVKAPVGFVSGVLGGSTGMAGPPMVIFFSSRAVEKQAFRANLALLFAVQNVFSIPLYAAGGVLTRGVLVSTIVLLPALLIGAPLGIRLSQRVNEVVFRKVALLAVIATGLVAVVSGLHLV